MTQRHQEIWRVVWKFYTAQMALCSRITDGQIYMIITIEPSRPIISMTDKVALSNQQLHSVTLGGGKINELVEI